MSDIPAPISKALRGAMWSVDHQAVRIFRLDDPVKLRRAIRDYRRAADNLLTIAQTERDARRAGQRPTSEG